MVTPEDRNANAEYIRMSDKIEILQGGSNQYNYANVDLILDIALRTKADVSFCYLLYLATNMIIFLFIEL